MNELRLPTPGDTYDPHFWKQYTQTLINWSKQFSSPIIMTARFIDATQLPSVTLLATLPSGAVYNDTSVLKVKP